MSIIKRKAGSEDIVKSVLEFDEVPTEGSHNLVESGAVAQAIGNLGQPLQWKGPATVAQLNAGITGIQEGWTYTLTDAGTLTDGSIAVEAGDEVAWTEDGEWFKVGGDSGKIAVFEVTFPSGVKTYPNGGEILDAINAGKYVVIDQPNLGVWEHTEWLLEYASRGAHDYIKFVNGSNTLVAARDNTEEEPAWQWNTGFVNGIVNVGNKTESDLVDGVLTIGGGNSLTRLTLTTVQTLTVLANEGVPNFALEIDNTGNGNDVTVTVKDSTGTTTLNASAAGGNTVSTGKYYQLTCVGNCWTLAEFTVPTP